jgi:hypothetical protein
MTWNEIKKAKKIFNHTFCSKALQYSLPHTNLTNMQRALEMGHLRVYPQRVQIRETLATILARVAEIPLVHTFHVRAVRPPAGQHLSALGAGLWFSLVRTGRLFLTVHLPIVAGEIVFVLNIKNNTVFYTYSLPQSIRVSVPSSEFWAPPPFGSKGGRHTRLGERGWGDPIPTKGQTLSIIHFLNYVLLTAFCLGFLHASSALFLEKAE